MNTRRTVGLTQKLLCVGSLACLLNSAATAQQSAATKLLKERDAEFRKITQLPVKAIILTHGHGDHTGGLPVFAAEGSPDIWARDNLGDENHPLTTNRIQEPVRMVVVDRTMPSRQRA